MQYYALIIVKASIVELDMLSNIIKQLAIARDFISESIAIFEKLPIIILIKDFYQFFLVIGLPLWDEVCKKKDHYSKIVWKSFKVAITFIQQMR